MKGSNRLYVCLSVRRLSVTPFGLCSRHRIIMEFSGVITNDRSDVHAKGQGQRSKVKVTEVNTQHSRFRTVTPVRIHIWLWNDAQRLKQHGRGALLFSRSSAKFQGHTGQKIADFDPNCCRTVTPNWFHRWIWNDAQSLMLYRRGALLFSKVIHQIWRSHRTKNCQFWPELSVSGL